MSAGKNSPSITPSPKSNGKSAPAGKQAPRSFDPEVRMDKVEKIREAVQRGAYNVPASKVAAKILEEMRRK